MAEWESHSTLLGWKNLYLPADVRQSHQGQDVGDIIRPDVLAQEKTVVSPS